MSVFEDFGLSDELLTAIKKLGHTKPTKIQEGSIPHIIKGKDVIGESATGSGKTLAFGCGIVEQVTPKAGLQALILTPTRELAEQVKGALSQLAHQKHIHITSIYGGVGIDPQIRDLTRVEVAVATPGRLLDHLQRGTIDTSKIKLLVLDEADRMFDMGFIDDVKNIIQNCPAKRQTLFFSATISPRVKELANQFMKDPTLVTATKMVDPSKLKQIYYDVTRNMKLSVLIHLLQHENRGLVMVFCNSRKTTDFVVKNLKKNKIDAIAIHGGFAQNKRTKTIEMFNNAKVGVLVCTDVAARGLHIDNVSHVYNYEIPNDPKDYVHRIGRTARAGEEGKVINLLCDFDHENFGRIQYEYRDFKIQKVEKPHVERIMAVRVDDAPRGRQSFGSRRPSHSRSFGGRSDSRRGSNNRGRPSYGTDSDNRSGSGGRFGRRRPSSGSNSSNSFGRGRSSGRPPQKRSFNRG